MGVVFADLHTHSYFSDGTMSPSGLISLAKLRGISVIALTDHDTTDGVKEAQEAGGYYGVEVIPGVELSCEYDGIEVHVLGYFIDVNSEDLQWILTRQKDRRRDRMEQMIERLTKIGIRVSLDEVLDLAGGGVVGRPHLAQLLVRKGYVKDLPTAYKIYIGHDRPYYVPTLRMDVSEAVEVIRYSGGLPVLAHPVFIPSQLLPDLLSRFPFWGVEVFYPEHSPRYIERLNLMVREMGLVATGGSDFHGSAKKEDYLGRVGLSKEAYESLIGIYEF